MLASIGIYLAVAAPFILVDLVWLKTMSERLYRPALGDILRTDPQLAPALLFYLIYPVGLVVFAVLPAHASASSARALMLGLLYGFFTYATYDLTNQATLRNWSTALTSLDVLWGSALGATCAYFGYLASLRLLGTA